VWLRKWSHPLRFIQGDDDAV